VDHGHVATDKRIEDRDRPDEIEIEVLLDHAHGSGHAVVFEDR
jgi:hypothetical protein